MASRAPNRWKPSEDELLRSAVAQQDEGNIDWISVALHLPGRNNKECRKRYVYALAAEPRKGRWSEEEDARLLEGVQQHGHRWALVSQVVQSRQPDQCSRRWHETANPNITHERWSLLEDEILFKAVQMHGRKWTEIVERYFYNRTPIAARKRYESRFQSDGKDFFASIGEMSASTSAF